MKLNENSILAKTYKWFFKNDLPVDGCKYITNVIFMIITIIPLTLLSFPGIILDYFINNNNFNKWFFRLGVSLIVYFSIFFILIMIVAPFILIMGNFSNFPEIVLIGVSFWILTFIIIIVYMIEDKKYDNILIIGYKSLKNKYCPKIEWFYEGKTKKE